MISGKKTQKLPPEKLRPSGSNSGLVLSDMYQKLVLFVFSNKTFPLFTKLEGG